MKKRQNNSTRASVLQILLLVALISCSAVLFVMAAPPREAGKGTQKTPGAKAVTVNSSSTQQPNGAVSGSCIGAEPATLAAAFAADYSCVGLGSVPGLPPSYGGLTLKPNDPNTLLIGGFANSTSGHIYQIGVVRDANMHITGFSGTAILYPDENSTIGQYNDGGVAFGPGDVLFATRYPVNQLEQTKPGSSAPDKIIDLNALGITSSVGSIGFVPAGFPGAGQMKIVSYNGGGWYTAAFTPDGNGTYDITSATLGPIIGGGPEGIAFVPPGSAVFPPNSTLVAQYSIGKVITAPLDANGDPVIADQQEFMAQLSGAEGAFIDPVTGDFLFSTFGSGNQVIRVGGFQVPTTPTPTPTPTPLPVSVSGTVSACPNPGAAPLTDATLTVTGDASGSSLTDGSGQYLLSNLPSGGSYTVTPSKSALAPGTSGSTVNTLDAMLIVWHYLGVTPLPSGCQSEAANVDGNASINTYDAVAIQRFFVGRTFGVANVGAYVFHPASRSYPGIASDQTGQDYDSVLLGDTVSEVVRGSGGALGETAAAIGAVALPQIDLNSSGTTSSAAVTVSSIQAREKLVGFQGDFTFDERVISFEDEPVRKAGLTNGNWSVMGSVLDGPGPIRTLRVSAFSTDFTPLSGTGALFELRVKGVKSGARTTELKWSATSDHFVFINADLKTQVPSAALSGSVISKRGYINQ